MDGNSLFGFVTVVASCIMMIPYIYKYELNDSCDGEKCSMIYNAIASKIYGSSVVASISVSVPIIVEFIYQYLSNKAIAMKGSALLLILILSLVIPDILILAFVIPFDNAILFICICHVRNGLLTCVVIKHTWEYGKDVFKLPVIMFLLTVGMAAQVLSCFSSFQRTQESSNELFKYIICCFSVVTAMYGTLAYKLLCKTISDGLSKMPSELLNLNVLLLPSISFGGVYTCLCIAYGGTVGSHSDAVFLATYNYAECVLFVAVYFFHVRLQNVLIKRGEDLQQQLESKGSFIRHMSHELRTKMNAALLSIEFLGGQLKQGLTDGTEEAVLEVSESCKSVVGVLNDVLNYDEMTDGTLLLARTRQGGYYLVESVAESFVMMVRYDDAYNT